MEDSNSQFTLDAQVFINGQEVAVFSNMGATQAGITCNKLTDNILQLVTEGWYSMEIQNSAMDAASMNALLDCLQSDVNVATGGWTYIGFLNWADLGGALDEAILSSIVSASPSIAEFHLNTMTQLSDTQGA